MVSDAIWALHLTDRTTSETEMDIDDEVDNGESFEKTKRAPEEVNFALFLPKLYDNCFYNLGGVMSITFLFCNLPRIF